MLNTLIGLSAGLKKYKGPSADIYYVKSQEARVESVQKSQGNFHFFDFDGTSNVRVISTVISTHISLTKNRDGQYESLTLMVRGF